MALTNEKIYANFAFIAQIPAGQSTPQNGYTATLTANGAGEYSFNGTFADGKWSFTATIAEAGLYQYAITFQNVVGRFLQDSGRVEVLPDPTQAPDRELTTHAERTLAAIEAVLENRASKDQQSYSIAGRSITRIPITELLELRKQYKAEVQSQTTRPKLFVYSFRGR